MYDAIIVGARCAGSAAALLLARQGHNVLLVDRATFPSDTISGHCILHRGTVRLKRWGLLERVINSGCPPITGVSTHFGDFTLSGDLGWIDGAPPAIAPRRTVLDALLQAAAVEAGAEFRQGFSVTGLVTDGDRVTGIRGQSQGGQPITERARVVIGADGKHSKVAQWVNAPAYNEVPSLTCWYLSYWDNLPCDALEIHWRPGWVGIALPTNDGLTLVAQGWPHEDFHAVRSDIEGHYLRAATAIPELADRIQAARRVEPFYGMADVPNFFRKPYGPGWALVGDAGHHKDPTPAYGISDAFCDAELLAEAVHAGLTGVPMDAALADYEQQRNARAIPDHEETLIRSRLHHWNAPEMMGLRAALRDNPADTRDFLAVIAKAHPREAFFAPENLARIMRQAALAPRPV